MAIQRRQRPANNSIYLTLKVIQAINQLRRHVKPRVSGVPTKTTILGSRSCLGLEAEALRSIEKGLLPVSPLCGNQLHASNRISRSRKMSRPSWRLQKPDRDAPADPKTSSDQVQHVLRSLDGNISSALTTDTCSDDRVFLLKQNEVPFEGLSMKETIQSLVLVYHAIEVLREVRATHADHLVVEKGRESGLDIDEKFIANYWHILLALQGQLLQTLARKAVEALIENDVDKRQRRLLNWLVTTTEQPEDKHLLSTTWPWSLKPSLAVLWGVCWMFYDAEHGTLPKAARGRVPQRKFLHDERLQQLWHRPPPNAYLQYGRELVGTHSQPEAQQQAVESLLRPSALPFSDGAAALSGLPSHCTPVADRFGAGLGGDARPTYPSRSLASQDIQTSYSSHPYLSGTATLPEPNILTVFTQRPQFDNHEYNPPWPAFPLAHDTLPPSNSHTSSGPGLSIADRSAEAQGFAAPPTFAYSNDDIFGPPAQAHDLNLDPFPNYVPNSYSIMGHERNDSVNSNMPTPVSLAGNPSPLLSPVGNRRPSSASPQSHVRQESEDRSSNDGDEGLDSLRRNHTFKRAEEPPRNAENKMVCTHQDCANLNQIFDRKCEWSKHMDKHDRPYKCVVKGCEKLQGFTYSGGLLRHEREVHKMHGGTKKSLFCPFVDCKRSSGSGFTRKENLAEHIRRVHRRTSMSTDLGHLIINRSEPRGAVDMRLSPEAFPRPETQENSPFSLKRKRLSDDGISEESEEPDLRAEVKRLRSVIEDKDARLRQLEDAVMALQQQGRR